MVTEEYKLSVHPAEAIEEEPSSGNSNSDPEQQDGGRDHDRSNTATERGQKKSGILNKVRRGLRKLSIHASKSKKE